jgi:hypothetical protein
MDPRSMIRIIDCVKSCWFEIIPAGWFGGTGTSKNIGILAALHSFIGLVSDILLVFERCLHGGVAVLVYVIPVDTA